MLQASLFGVCNFMQLRSACNQLFDYTRECSAPLPYVNHYPMFGKEGGKDGEMERKRNRKKGETRNGGDG